MPMPGVRVPPNLLLAVAIAIATVPTVAADDRGDPPRRGQHRGQPDHRGRFDRQRGHGPRDLLGLRGTELARYLFTPTPEDRGPLEPGEEETLLAFAREHAPRIHFLMQRIKQRDPDRFAAELEEHAPRLRQLKRLFELDPQLARLVKSHAENRFRARRLIRVLHRAPEDSARYQEATRLMRNLLAENVELEINALETLAEQIDKQAEKRAMARLELVLDDEEVLAQAPRPVQELVREMQDVAANGGSENLRHRLLSMLRRQIADDAQQMRTRAAAMAEDLDGEVDRRFDKLKNMLEQRGRAGHRRRGPEFRR